jgi:hypothetical protein
MSFRGRSILQISPKTMNDFLTAQINRMIVAESIVVTHVKSCSVTYEGETTYHYEIEFYPANEKLQELIGNIPIIPTRMPPHSPKVRSKLSAKSIITKSIPKDKNERRKYLFGEN